MNPPFKILFATSFFFLAFVSASRDPGDFYQGCEDGTKGCFGAPPFCMETKVWRLPYCVFGESLFDARFSRTAPCW